MGLSVPFLLFLNGGVLALWLFSEVRNALFPFIILMVGYPQIRATYAISFSSADSSQLSVMSYNLRSFGPTARTKNTINEVKQLVSAEQPDVICFQEFRQHASHLRGTVNVFRNLGYTNYHFKDYLGRTDYSLMGVMVFSKYPIVNWGEIKGGEGANQTIFADIHFPSKDTVRIYCSHLKSIGLDKHVRLKPQNEESYVEMLKKLAKSSEKRGAQIGPVIEHLEACEHPFVFASDLNELPYTYVYSSLRNLGKNSFETAGTGFGFTFNPIDQSQHMQYLRIDNQFYGNGLHCSEHKVIRDVEALDHYPILSTYHF